MPPSSRQSSSFRAARPSGRGGPVRLLALVAFVLHLLVAAYPRMLAPVVPLVVWLATLAVVRPASRGGLDQPPVRTT